MPYVLDDANRERERERERERASEREKRRGGIEGHWRSNCRADWAEYKWS